MFYSQNGYQANTASLIAGYTVPGSAVKLNLRKGDTSVLLLDLAAWFNAHVEKLVQTQCGGYNPRSITGSSTLSNHASGTAIDLNWSKHPQHKLNTFPAGQQSAIRSRLKFYEGVIRWGGDYSVASRDDMHFEINKPPADVARIAAKIRSTTPRKVDYMKFSITMPALKEGDNDGDFPSTYRRITRIQRIVGVAVDGDWGPKTTAGIASWCNVPTGQAKTMTENLWREILGLS